MWVTLEGVNGVGKTYLAHAAAERLGGRCRLLSELTDLTADSLPGRVVEALRLGGGTFLRGGSPAAETLALLALKVHAHEDTRAAVHRPAVLLEDRGVDTVAVYQAAIMSGPYAPVADSLAVADQIYATAATWLPRPGKTVLLVDDLAACAARFEHRTGTQLSAPDRALLAQVEALYYAQAAREPDRFTILDRRDRDQSSLVDAICRACRAATDGDIPCPA